MSYLKILIAILLLIGDFHGARADVIDEYVTEQLERRNIPGVSLAVVRDGRVVKAAGFGLANLELRTPATPGSVYEIGSITKQFTAEVIMLLVEEGKLSLDDPISKYLTDLPAAWAKITVRQLLTHTSGLKDWEVGTDFSYRREYTPNEFIKLLAQYPLDFQPGERWAYTNTGFPLLGMIVEQVTGRTYEAFVTERIFKPLGMNSTRLKHPAEIVPFRASGYKFENGKWRNGELARPQVIAANGGILSTVLDMAKWDAALYTEALLKRSSFEQMLVPARLNNGQTPINHGFAWFTDAFRGHRIVSHWGSTVAGYSAVVFRYVDDKVTVILLCNVDDGALGVDAMARRIAGFYIPGAHIGGIKEQPDPDPQTTERLRQLLRDLAEGRDSDVLAENLRRGVPQSRKEQIARHLREISSFVFIDSEKYGKYHFMLDPKMDRIIRYRMVTGGRAVYYSFHLNSDGKVARFNSEEE